MKTRVPKEIRSILFILFILLLSLVAGCTSQQVEKSSSGTPDQVDTNSTPTQDQETITPQTTMPASQTNPRTGNHPLFLAHYMPWYQTPEVTGEWGWHWTMNVYQPDLQDADGRREIASHYYPLTGPYDSSDEDILEYQVMLMKLSGIDGVIIDWYGSEDFWDYGLINAGSQKLIQKIQEAGLVFAICYEDRTVGNMIDNGHLDSAEALSHAQQQMLYLQENWFKDEAYLKMSGRPLLLVFGNPPYFRTSSDWETIFSPLEITPYLVTEDSPMPPVAPTSYPWTPMSLSSGGELSQSSLENYLQNFYKKAEGWDFLVAGAFPGFHDIYEDAGVGASYGYLDARDGNTFRDTLQTALANYPDIVQLVTWNDYGEGTNIEPTLEYGYQYLEIILEAKSVALGEQSAISEEDWQMPLQIYLLRKQYAEDSQVNLQLDQAVAAIYSGDLELARAVLSDITK
jgi:hypothetical protein